MRLVPINDQISLLNNGYVSEIKDYYLFFFNWTKFFNVDMSRLKTSIILQHTLRI